MIQNLSFAHVGILAVFLLLTAAVIWAVVVSIQDQTASTFEKIVWVIGLLAFPVLGLLVWGIVQVFRRRNGQVSSA